MSNKAVRLTVAVPDKIFGLTLFLDFIDRCHSLPSLHPPPAALGSLPGIEPVRMLLRGILSPLCLPVPPQRLVDGVILTQFLPAVKTGGKGFIHGQCKMKGMDALGAPQDDKVKFLGLSFRVTRSKAEGNRGIRFFSLYGRGRPYFLSGEKVCKEPPGTSRMVPGLSRRLKGRRPLKNPRCGGGREIGAMAKLSIGRRAAAEPHRYKSLMGFSICAMRLICADALDMPCGARGDL